MSIAFDFSDAGCTATSSGDYVLLYHGGNGQFSGTQHIATVGGDRVVFSGIDSTELSSEYFTLGATDGVLPASIIRFELE